MDQDEAIAQVRAIRNKFLEVETLKGKWKESRTYCVAPKDVTAPLHLMVKAARLGLSRGDQVLPQEN